MIKKVAILLLSFIVYMPMIQAEENTIDTQLVKQLVQKVKSSTGDKRRVAMNELKVKLRSMNQETRQRVLTELQKSFGQDNHNVQHSGQRGSNYYNSDTAQFSNHMMSGSHTPNSFGQQGGPR